MNPQMVGTDLMWVQMAINQVSYDRKQQVVETGDFNAQMVSIAICDCIAQLVREFQWNR